MTGLGMVRHCNWRRAALALVPLAVTPLFAAAAVAQERSPWFSARPIPSQQVGPRATDERTAAVLYAEAQADVDAGRLDLAARTLDVLVTRHPDSPLVEVARRDLLRLRSARAQVTPAQVTPAQLAPAMPQALTASPSLAPPASAVRPVAHGAAPPASSPDVTSIGNRAPAPAMSAVRLANEDFRQQAGDRVFFADGSADLGQRARIALEAQADWLNRHPDVLVQIEGHADDHGSQDLNREIAERRAEVVRLRLTDLGVPRDRISTRALGRSEPLAHCAETACKAQNRRVVTVIVQVPTKLGFDRPARRSLGAAASAVGQPISRTP